MVIQPSLFYIKESILLPAELKPSIELIIMHPGLCSRLTVGLISLLVIPVIKPYRFDCNWLCVLF